MNNYNISALILRGVQYQFTKPEKKDISITVNDSIKIVGILNNEATLDITRELCFGPNTNSFVRINYEVVVAQNEPVAKQELVDALVQRNTNLAMVYSKISLLISQITNMSPFGVIVTPPSYDPRRADIQ